MPHTPHLAALATARLGWQLSRPLMALASAMLLMFTLSGCSGCSDEDEGCEGVVCLDGGVCSASSGQCVNPEVCGEVACLPGYSCGADSTCVADTPCDSDDACERGVCQRGACVNRDSCTTQADCVAPNTCDTATGACVNDPCQDGSITCARGVCSTSAGACVNEVVCTQATEQTACLAGNICVNQVCVDEATFCGQLACERGVCSPSARACVSAPNCGGEDARCVAGEYCAPDNTCQPNVCDANMTDCPRGVCDAASGECVNPTSCDDTQDCIDDNVCLSGQCTPRDQACGEDGCPGNQLCVIDAASAACQEDVAAGCESALDCTGDRICAQGACADAPACPAEDTPNNTPETATNFQQAAPTGSLTASLCQGDVDVYTFDTRLNSPALGELVVDLGVLPQDLGLGSPVIELRSPQGALLSSATAGMDGRARVQAPVALLSQGVYRITVRASADVRAPGVRYALTAGVFAPTTLAACQNAPTLTEGEDAQGSTVSGASNGLRVACGLDQSGTAENIWRFTLAERSFVQLTLTPAETTPALAFTIRADCLSSLPDDACGVAPTTPTLGRALEAGSYLVVVQGATADGGGEYTLRYTSAPAICSGADNSCQDANTALICNDQGTAFDTLSCDNGCDTLTGRCNRSRGDICSLPLPLQGTQQDIEINWQRLSPAFDPGADGCVPVREGVSATAGPDRAVQVSVGPGQALLASLSASDADTALYLVEDCDDSANTCLVGVNAAAGAEQLVWYNDGEQARQLSLIADIASVSDTTQPSTLSVELKDAVCAPASTTCGTNGSGDDISQTCDATGDSYTDTTICNFGCDAATGLCEPPPNDTCDGATPLTSGVPVMGDLALYSRAYTLSSGPQCSFASTSREALYSITLNVGDVLDVSMTALSPTLNPVLRVVEGCDMNQLGACMRSANDTSAGSGESVRFRATRAGEYIIVAAASNSSSADGWEYGLTATITPQQCVPGSPSTCNGINLEYCDSFGLNNTTSCSGGCADGACVNPRGDTCADPILMTGNSGSLTGTFASGTNEYEGGGLFGTCYFGSVRSEGKDIFYRIDLQAGELATFSLNASGFNGALFITENCYDPQDCIDNLRSSDQTSLQYYAYSDSTVYVIVDNTSSSSDSSSYTLNWTVNNTSVCAPNSSRCVDATTAGLCDASGTTETTVTCAGGCERGACVPQAQANDVCATVASGQPVGDGVSLFIDNISDFTNNINVPAASSCAAGKTTGGRDLFYKMALEPGELLRASARGYGSFNPLIYVITDCADAANSCLVGADEGTSGILGAYELATLSYTNTTPNPQEVIVGFDANFSTASGPLQIILTKEQGPCIPGQATCNEQGTGLLVCNAASELESFPCDGTCTGIACDTPAGDFCADAIALQTQSGTINDSWAGGTSTFTLPLGASGSCYISGSTSTNIGNGREDFYKIDLLAGDSLSVTLTGSTGAMLALLEDCAGPNSCVANNPLRGPTTLQYYAYQPRTLYIVADHNSSSSTLDYTLTWEVTQGLTCSPGAKACIDDTTASVCAADGLSETQYPCANGCAFGACQIDVAARDTCDTVALSTEDVGQGLSVVVDYSQLSNNVSMPTSGSCVDGDSSAGNDASFRVVLAPGEIAVASVQGLTGNNPVIYAITDCNNAASTCLAGGGEVGSTEFASFQYANTTGAEQAIIVVVDSSLSASSSSNGPALVEIGVQQPECMFGDIQCAPDNATLLVCNAQNLFDSYSCDGACTNDQCDAPRGDECFDPIRLTGDTGSVSGSWSGGTNSFAPSSGTYGACLIPSAPAARERYHAINLQAGELLSLSLDTSITSALLFILEDCSGPDACLANTPLSGGAQRLTYLAAQDQRVLVLADSTSSSTTSSYTLGWTVTQGAVCNPNATRCVDANTVATCNAVGSAEALYSCPEGCQDSACIATPSARDVCADVAMAATDIGQGVSVYANYADFTGNITMPTPGSCVDGKASTGRDFFYKVRLDAGEVLRASAQGLSSNNPVIYAITDCSDAANTCVAGGGEVGSSSEFASFLYANTTGAAQTLIVGVDSSSTSPSGFVQVNLSVEQPQCTPGQTLCDASGSNLQVCNASSLYDLFPCQGSCTATTCDTPAGDFCADAIPLSGMSGQVTGSWASGTNTFSPLQGLTGQCYLHSSSHSPVATETFYRIDLQANDVLNASISSGTSGAQLFILEDCVNANACARNGVEPGDTTLSYHTLQARTVYLVADNSSASATQDFTVSWEVLSGLTCAPNQARCLDADTAALCSRDGTSEQTVTCVNGCSYRGCVPTPAERNTCASAAAAATDIGQGISDFAILSSYTNDVSINAGACIGDNTNGNDLFYKVTLAPDEIVSASIQTYSGSSNPSIYAITDCADAANTCVKGRSEVGSTEFASFLYANETGAPQTLIIGADTRSNTSSANAVHVIIEKLVPTCSPGTVQCDAQGVALVSCDAYGLETRYTCEGGCNANACVTPRGDVCVDAIALTGPSGSVTGSLPNRTNSFSEQGGFAGQCYIPTGNNNDNFGMETFYQIDLQAGEELHVSYEGSSNGYMFLLEDCFFRDACVASDTSGSDMALRYYASQATSLVIVIDSDSTSSATNYTLSWEVVTGAACVAGTSRCVDTFTAATCAANGQSEAQVSCVNGCFAGGCVEPAATRDSCDAVLAAPQDIGDGFNAFITYGDYANSLGFTSANSCAGAATPGRDMFYKVTLAPGELVDASVRGYTNSNPAVYVITDCSASATSCLAGNSQSGSSSEARVTYANATGASQTVLVGVDSTSSASSSATSALNGPALVTIKRTAPECTPATTQCGANGRDIVYCDGDGIGRAFTCPNGCNNGACVNPYGDFCADAIPLNSGGAMMSQSYMDSVADLQNELTNTLRFENNAAGCITNKTAAGPDRIYAVTLLPGQSLDATLVPKRAPNASGGDGTDMVIYVLSDCLNALSCLGPNSDDAGIHGVTETVQYTNSTGSAQTIFLVADTADSFGNGGYDLTVNIL